MKPWKKLFMAQTVEPLYLMFGSRGLWPWCKSSWVGQKDDTHLCSLWTLITESTLRQKKFATIEVLVYTKFYMTATGSLYYGGPLVAAKLLFLSPATMPRASASAFLTSSHFVFCRQSGPTNTPRVIVLPWAEDLIESEHFAQKNLAKRWQQTAVILDRLLQLRQKGQWRSQVTLWYAGLFPVRNLACFMVQPDWPISFILVCKPSPLHWLALLNSPSICVQVNSLLIARFLDPKENWKPPCSYLINNVGSTSSASLVTWKLALTPALCHSSSNWVARDRLLQTRLLE